MGRSEPSIGRPPAAFRRDARAKKAKTTINQLIPLLLATHPRARRGIETAELIVNPPALQSTTKPPRSNHQEAEPCVEEPPQMVPTLKLRLQVADTLTAAQSLIGYNSGARKPVEQKKPKSRVAILNMASALSPGGGFLNGASSQEESLCMRTTLLPSLRDEHYRLPELGAIFSPDVLVFRDEGAEEVLDKSKRYFVDCISAAMLRDPESDRDALGRGNYVHQKDRELVLQKMKVVMRIAQAKGISKLVLGAWGCGAYGNPVGEIATAWRKVLCTKGSPSRSHKNEQEAWDGIDEVVFAIKDAGMANAFAEAFGEALERESCDAGEEEDEEDEGTGEGQELLEKIREIESRLDRAANPKVKEGLASVLAGLVSQLALQNTGVTDDVDSVGQSSTSSEIDEAERYGFA